MFKLIHKATGGNLTVDTLSGLTVALALVPEAVAFAFVAGVEPIVGLYGAFIMGLIAAIFGGRPGMISGATGAMAVVMVALVSTHGVEYLFAAVLLAGIIQILAGLGRLGKFIRMVPHSVMLGFVNGLAIVIFLAQFKQFKMMHNGVETWLPQQEILIMLGLVALTMLIIHFLPKFTKVIPSTLAAILVVTLLVIGLDIDTRTVQDVLVNMTNNPDATIGGNLPVFAWPDVTFSLETLWIILPFSLILAGVGLIESLLTMTLIDDLTETRGQGNRECIGQGLGNAINGMFGGMGGCAMIGQSMINIKSGGRSRWSGISAALFLLIFILYTSQYIELIPVAVLVGVMFIVVLGTFEWSSIQLFGKVPKSDVFVVILVAVVTVWQDLAIAVIIGVIVSALVFAYQQAKHLTSTVEVNDAGAKVYHINGSVFFGSIHCFKEMCTAKDDPENVIIDFANARVYDHSGIEAIDKLAEKYEKYGKTLKIRHLSPECLNLLKNAGNVVEVDKATDPQYHIADDKLG